MGSAEVDRAREGTDVITREYTVWCDFKSTCCTSYLTLCVNNQIEARKYAELAGWGIRRSGYAICPACSEGVCSCG